jgi:hypothetical protein
MLDVFIEVADLNELHQFLLDAIVTIGLWLRSALVAGALLYLLRRMSRFRARPQETAFFAVLLASMQLAAFPPMRSQGDWRKQESGEPATILKSRELDQLAFGGPPHFIWPGSSWRYASGLSAFDVSDVYAASVFEQRIDFIDLSVEMAMLSIVVFLLHSHERRKRKRS